MMPTDGKSLHGFWQDEIKIQSILFIQNELNLFLLQGDKASLTLYSGMTPFTL